MYKSQADAVKDWLKAYRANEDYIDKQLERLRTLKARMMSVGAQRLTDMPKPPSGSKDILSDYVIQVESLELSIQRNVETQETCRKVLVGMIDELEKAEEKVVIRDRYLYGMEWSDVLYDLCRMDKKAEQNMDSCKRQMYRAHEYALIKMAKGWNSSEKKKDEKNTSDMK